MTQTQQVYLGLGGNHPDSLTLIKQALHQIKHIDGVQSLVCSRFYRTEPVSSIPQSKFVNAVCRIVTSLDAHKLLESLQQIEGNLGKVPKPKEASRPIDIDILFYENEEIDDAELTIPHPRWHERLFVLVPLSDLTDEILLPNRQTCNLVDYLKSFPNKHQETVELIEEELCILSQ